MYKIEKRMEIAGAHCLSLSYGSKCSQLHGHNWVIKVRCAGRNLNTDGMLVDFTHIKSAVSDVLDHQNLNTVLRFNPTAENIAKWICDQIPFCYEVEVQESEGNIATYTDEDYVC